MEYKNEEEIEDYKDDEEHRLSILKKLGIIILIILGIILIFLFLKNCSKVDKIDLNKTLLDAGKEYYEYNEHLLPSSIGDCKNVTLSTLSKSGLINKSKYSDCSNENTHVKVCKLESGKYHFVALLDCVSERTSNLYGEWNKGYERDVISDSSDVKFKYQVQYLDLTKSNLGDSEELWEDEITYSNYKTEAVVKYYRYKDLQYIWNITAKRYYPNDKSSALEVDEYYANSPAANYTNKDSENKSVSKYFSTTETKVYWMDSNGNRNFSPTKPDNVYIYPDNPIYQTRYRTAVWTETSKPITVGPTKMWVCKKPEGGTTRINSLLPCEENTINSSYTITEKIIYTCDGGVTEVGEHGTCYQCTDGSGLRTDRTSCGSYTWGSYTTTPCDTSSDLCESMTITIYQWYKLVSGARKYYPSNSAVSSGEKTYYAVAPAAGLIKDTATTTTGYKWYKIISTTTTSYYSTSPQTGATKTDKSRWTDFTKWSTSVPKSLGTEGTRVIESKNKIKLKRILGNADTWLTFNEEYMELEALLLALQDKGYKVYSLDDITASGELKYKVELYIRNKEVK